MGSDMSGRDGHGTDKYYPKEREAIEQAQIIRQEEIREALAANNKEWVAGIEPLITKLIEVISYGDYKNGNTDTTGMVDEGEVMQYNYIASLTNQWHQLKKNMEESR